MRQEPNGLKDGHDVLAALDAVIANATAADRPALIVALAARLAHLGAGLAVAAPVVESRDRWLTPPQAADLAGVEVKRLYDWARNHGWAVRPTRRCLRIHERGFMDWLKGR